MTCVNDTGRRPAQKYEIAPRLRDRRPLMAQPVTRGEPT
jgi:hypothetical protein